MANTAQIDNIALSDEEIDIYEPGTTEELVSILKRNFNILKEDNVVQRKNAINTIYNKLQDQNYDIEDQVSQNVLIKFHKQLLEAFSDKSDRVREFSIKILQELLQTSSDIIPFLPYIFSILTIRANAHDLEGIENLPEVMRPTPTQKPKVLISLVEKVEEIRIELLNVVEIIVQLTEPQDVVNFIDDLTNLIRVFCMDPCPQIQERACKVMSTFCKMNKDILLHFTQILARAILLPLVNKQKKIRIAALEALTSILQCGIWKYNAFVFEYLIGFRDPNNVPIKDFFEPTSNINYFATLINDKNQVVREYFIRTLGEWLLHLEDRVDHVARILIYVLAGFWDTSESIYQLAYDIVQKAGQQEYDEKEKDNRDIIQYGMDAKWTRNSEQLIKKLYYPNNFKRPDMGSRNLIKSHVRKWFPAIYKELEDYNSIENQTRASQLLVTCCIYCEDYLIQYVDTLLKKLIWFVEINNKYPKLADIQKNNVQFSLRLIGRYVTWKSFFPIIVSGIKGEFFNNSDYMNCAIIALYNLTQGVNETTLNYSNEDTKDYYNEIFQILNENLEQISAENYKYFALIIENIISSTISNVTQEEKQQFYEQNLDILHNILNVCLFYQLFEKQFLIHLQINDEILNKIGKIAKESDILQLIKKLPKQNKQKANENSSVSFGSYSFKIIISQIAQIQAFEENCQQIKFLSDSIQDQPEQVDFILKFIKYLLKSTDLKDRNKYFYQNILIVYSKCYQWFENTKADIKQTSKMFLQTFLELNNSIFTSSLSSKIESIYENTDILINIGQIIYTVSKVQRKYMKNDEYLSSLLLVPLIDNVFNHEKLQTILLEKITIEDNYVFPILMRYILSRIEKIQSDYKIQHINLLFNNFQKLLNFIPQCDNIYKGDDYIYPNYKELINSLMQYTIDEQNHDIKKMFIKLLITLAKKTTINFQQEFETSSKMKQFARQEILRNIYQILVKEGYIK